MVAQWRIRKTVSHMLTILVTKYWRDPSTLVRSSTHIDYLLSLKVTLSESEYIRVYLQWSWIRFKGIFPLRRYHPRGPLVRVHLGRYGLGTYRGVSVILDSTVSVVVWKTDSSVYTKDKEVLETNWVILVVVIAEMVVVIVVIVVVIVVVLVVVVTMWHFLQDT